MLETEADRNLETVASHRLAAERVIATMREQADDTLPLHTMAEIANLSPYHFVRVFRQVTGITPGEFMAAVRLDRAK